MRTQSEVQLIPSICITCSAVSSGYSTDGGAPGIRGWVVRADTCISPSAAGAAIDSRVCCGIMHTDPDKLACMLHEPRKLRQHACYSGRRNTCGWSHMCFFV